MQLTLIKKLQSNKGASLMVALLLFLVCAAVGAVILAAAAATAGRMSERAKMDQRYYSVSSAAELLANQLCDKEVKIERIRTTTAEAVLTFNGTDVTLGTPDIHTDYKTYVNRSINTQPFIGSMNDLSFLSARAVILLYGSNLSTGLNTEDAMQYTFSNEETGNGISLNHGSGYSDLTIGNINWKMESNGTLKLTISSGEENTDRYSIVLTLIPEINERAETLEEPPVTALDPSTGQFIQTTTTTTTKTSTIKWKVGGITKEVS